MAVDTSLSERKLTILKAIIQNYLEILKISVIFFSRIRRREGFLRIKDIGFMLIC